MIKELSWTNFDTEKPVNNGNGVSNRCLFFCRTTGCVVLGIAVFSETDEGIEEIEYAFSTGWNKQENESFAMQVDMWADVESSLPKESDFILTPDDKKD